LYAIVNSICETADDVDGVKITIEGSSNVKFWDEIDLSEVFLLNESLIEVDSLESETEEAAVQADEAEGEPESTDSDAVVAGADGAIAGVDAYAAEEDGTAAGADGAIAGVTGADASAEAQTE